MFGRRTPRDSDLTAVARRRLTTLAQQLEHARAGAEPNRADDDTTAGFGPADGARVGAPAADTTPGAVRSPAPAQATSDLATAWGRPGRHAGEGSVRWLLTPHQLVVLALLVTAAVLVAAWWVLRSVPDPEPVQLTSERSVPQTAPTDPGAPSVSTPADGAPASSSAAGVVVVDVAGAVRRPGIVELPAGSRVVDAVQAAGGALPKVDTRTLNLARTLVDGEQLLVGVGGPPAGPAAPPSVAVSTGLAPAAVNLNTATQAELELLPGIGPVTATAILAWRTEHGAFTSVDELLEVSGIGEATLAELAPYVHV